MVSRLCVSLYFESLIYINCLYFQQAIFVYWTLILYFSMTFTVHRHRLDDGAFGSIKKLICAVARVLILRSWYFLLTFTILDNLNN